jgi:hypothetical protein
MTWAGMSGTETGTSDLDMVREEWLRMCGPCELGVSSSPCACAPGDYRPVMASLVQEVERLRKLVREPAGGGS